MKRIPEQLSPFLWRNPSVDVTVSMKGIPEQVSPFRKLQSASMDADGLLCVCEKRQGLRLQAQSISSE